MSEIEPEITSKTSDDLKEKNLVREENIQKETAKVKKIIDLILKKPKQPSSKAKAEKTVENSGSSNEKKTEKK